MHQEELGMRRKRNILASLLGVLFLTGLPAFSATPPRSFYAATNGNDANAGTIGSPVRTIKQCIQLLTAGDTCFIRAGTYNEGIGGTYGKVPVGTSFSNAITVKAYNGETVVVGPSGFGTDAYPEHRSFYWIIEGITFDGNRIYDYPIAGLNGDYVRIANCEVRNGKRSGMLPEGDYWEMLNLNVHHNGSDNSDHGIYWDGHNGLIDGGSYHDNSGYGIHIFHSAAITTSDNTVRNTRIYGNSSDGFGAGLITLSTGYRNSAYNNLIYGNGPGREVSIDYRCIDCSLYNNTIVPAPGIAGIAINTNGSYVVNTTIKNNIIYTTGPAIVDMGSTTVTGSNLTTNPGFKNAGALDFTLTASSKAIDVGEDLSAFFTKDMAGKPRPAGKGFDIGAFEYTPLTSDTNPPVVSVTVVGPK